jgi:hypothetical protein
LKWTFALLMIGVIAAAPARAEDADLQVLVIESHADLHTGPGRGYPVAQVVERGEWINILLRRIDWFKVRTQRGKEGWVSRTDIENMATRDGGQLRLRDVLYEDSQSRRFEVGFAGGLLEDDSIMMVRAGYRLHENLTGEFAIGQASGDFSSSMLYYVSVLSEPFPEWRVSPFFSLGLGRFNNTPKATLVGAIKTESNMANVGVGARAYLTRRFVVRGDYRRHVVFIDENRITDYNEISLGFSIFFH